MGIGLDGTGVLILKIAIAAISRRLSKFLYKTCTDIRTLPVYFKKAVEPSI